MEQGRQQSIALAVSVSSGAGSGLFTKSWNHVSKDQKDEQLLMKQGFLDGVKWCLEWANKQD